MSTRGLLVLEIVSILAFATSGYSTSPYFICQPSPNNNQSYTITMSRQEEISIVNCTRTRVNDLLVLINQTAALRGRPIRLHMSANILDDIHLEAVTNLHLGNNALTEVRLQRFAHLLHLNLSSNRIPSLQAIELRPNITLASLDVSRNRLLRLEQSSVLPTKRLYLTSNNIFDLDQNLTLPAALQLLDLTRNEIENISMVSISSPNLVHLNLSVNLINAISRTTFQHLPALETLVLECNKILEIEPGTFSANLRLVELNLRDNNLAALKKGVFDELVNLQVLDISKNDLLKLAPDAVQNLNLIDFSVSENAKLCDAECKEDMEFLLVLGGRLRALKMDRLRLRQFPVMLTTSVRRLDLSQNILDTVQLGNLENFPLLEALTLSGNDIQTVEKDAFSRMEFLEVLCLDNNKLKRVPTILPQPLKVLHLHRNRIVAIGRNDFNGLTNLKTLKLNSNSIEIVENGAFRFLVALEMLDISNNPIKVLSTEAFEGPSKLQILQAANLSMVHINVTDVRYFPISELPNLRRLNLSRSAEMVKSFLTDLPLLATVKQLEVLDLSHANLTQVPTYLENFLPRLQHLGLAGNALNCTNSWWHEWRQSNMIEADQRKDQRTGLTVRIAPMDTKPIHDNVSVDSQCAASVSFETMTSQQFWASVNNTIPENKTLGNTTKTDIKLVTSRAPIVDSGFQMANVTAKSTTLKRKKLSSRSLADTKADYSSTQTNVHRSATNQTVSNKLLQNITESSPLEHTDQNITKYTANLANTTSRTWFGTSTNPSPNGTHRAESLVWESSTELSSANQSTLNATSTKKLRSAKADELRNSSTDLISFFDWFPSFNETFEPNEQTAPMDNLIEYTHPGLIIFSAITCFLSVIFLTLIAPSCLQQYKLSRCKYRNTYFEDDYQQNIEISSVSAFVETEISLD